MTDIDKKNSEVRVRIAPSPTGALHVGLVRTALYNWLFARHHNGKFILRIDDTDLKRNIEEALEPILRGLRWLGIDWDEGPDIGGPHAPYYQSQRAGLYQAAVQKLLEKGFAYRDYATFEEVKAEREAALAKKLSWVYSRRWMAETRKEQARFEAQGRKPVVRLKMPRAGKLVIHDLVRGRVEFEWAREQDHVIQRADGSCLYHLANVVDDHDFEITHVIRGEEHLSNTPRQSFIAQSLGYHLPRYAHLPYVAEPGTKNKLSKRRLEKYLKGRDFVQLVEHGRRIADSLGLETAADSFNPVVIGFYEKVGFVPEAVLNYLVLLGWSLDDRTEYFTRGQLIANFSLERVIRAPASFDPKRLMAFQVHYMMEMPTEQKVAMVMPYLEKAGLVDSPASSDDVRSKVAQVLEAAGDRVKVAGDILDYSDFFVADGRLPYDERAFERAMRRPGVGELLGKFRDRLATADAFNAAALDRLMREFVESEGIKVGEIIHALRIAVTGKPVGFGLFDCLAILGRASCIARINRALKKVKSTGNIKPVDSVSPLNFIENIVAEDSRRNKYRGRVHTRFPPEPNGYLHIGHAKSICLNFGIAAKFSGVCNLRFDDTNPSKEETEYVESIKEDIRWLGFDWENREFYASDYFEQLYQWAVQLIRKGKAYVCDLSAEEIRQYRGTLTEPGRNSPYRNRSVEENLDLFCRMRAGEFEDGSKVLRAKIDMAAPNLNMRDPVMYRILHATHHRTGDKWCIYPTYDWAHGQSDSIEGITHSICTLEFEDHRPLYDWYLDQLEVHHPQQIEFARLNVSHTVVTKRKLLELVNQGYVSGWDDPRMPTISGMRRRGYTPESIRNFCDRIGVAKRDNLVDIAMLEHCVREDLNRRAPRVMAVLRPLRVVIDNYPEGQVEELDAVNNPEDPGMGMRKVPFSRVLDIEQEDFQEEPSRKFFRLAPGREVRLRYGYFITCKDIVKDEKTGEVTELHCTYDPATRGGDAPDGHKVKATLHWVSAEHSLPAEVRLYDHLFTKADPAEVRDGADWKSNLNPDSLKVLKECRVEPSLADAAPGARYQFERQGYFCVDPDSSDGLLVFNRTVSLRDTWARLQKTQKKAAEH
ncbi:hypothetical protein CH330_07720 [candidate division WOR-3 bacterium JGI_Cruoil_03_51_56]|uniref:Multifunctional fusion protein n=1 Tax=candidate division WOR-3 bacterium JGI_Cruoil_03_51_56 TaxID=1973747 RepID=A0A235BQZ8_UNCW3|nr:MAG: hypothetical protein CH330_07720 [candidate division WOR-3 bacterium JGI_Cruoil_03_51_56]